jgi:hypothetical protein
MFIARARGNDRAELAAEKLKNRLKENNFGAQALSRYFSLQWHMLPVSMNLPPPFTAARKLSFEFSQTNYKLE